MEPTASSANGRSAGHPSKKDGLRHLPPEVQAAFERFETTGDLDALNLVIFAILRDIMPRKQAPPPASLPGTTRLIDDLGFDSLAIAEVVFCTEDLFNISIANEEIIQVRTLDDLRGFVRTKVTARAAR